MSRWSFALTAILGLCLFGQTSAASIFHIVRQGDTVNSLATEYYGDAKRASVIRAANRLPLDEEAPLTVGEPLIIPESAKRIIRADDNWSDLAQLELGTPDRAWYLAKINNTQADRPPAEGQIIDIPFMMPLALSEGLAATVERFYPNQTGRDRVATARLLIKLNPGLRPRGMVRGTRVILPLTDLSILPEKRAAVERVRNDRRSQADQSSQQAATRLLEDLPELLARGAYVELLLLAGRISGATELTEAQQVTLHRYLGQAMLALERPELAERQFTKMIELQPDVQFDQVTTSPTVIELLERARRSRQPDGAGGPEAAGAVNNR